MADKQFPVSVIIKAVDKATAPLRAITEKVKVLTAPLSRFGDQWKDFSKSLNLGGIGGALSGFGGALKNVGGQVFALGAKLFALAGVAGFAFFSIVKSAVDAGDKLGEMADRVGLTVDAYASLQHAAAQADVEQESFNAAMDKFNKHLGEMTVGKGGEFLAFLNKVSPALAKQMKAAKGTEAALASAADFAGSSIFANASVISASAAFGKSGLQMGRFLHQGSAAIQEQQRRFMELTGSQEAFAKGAGNLDNQIRETELAFTGLRNVAAGALFPAFTQLGKALTDFMVKNRDGIQRWATGAAAAIQKWIDGGGIGRLVNALTSVAGAVVRVVDFLGPMGTALAGVAVLALPLISALGSLGIAAISLAAQLGPLIASWPVLAAAIGTAAGTLGGFIVAAAPFIAAAIGVAAAGKAIYDNWGDIILLFGEVARAFDFYVTPIFEKAAGLKNLFSDPVKALNDFNDANRLAFGAITRGPQAIFNAQAAAAPPASVTGPQSTEARVSVDFSNLPRGVRVTTEPNSSQPVDLSLGYSMAAP